MRRRPLLVAIWATGTAVAIVVAWQAVALVGHQVTESRPAELSRRELVARLEPTTAGTATAANAAPAATVTTLRSVATSSTATATTIRSGRARTPPAVSSPPDPKHPRATTGQPPTAAPPPPPAAAPPPPPAAPPPTASPPTAPPPPPPQTAPGTTAPPATEPPPAAPTTTATYALVGGRAEVRCRGGNAELVWATPKTGFAVEVKEAGPDEIDVEFESDRHRSRLKVECDDGIPEPEISEDDDGDDGPG